MRKGTVKFFNSTKGFGFITDDANGQEYFVGASGLVQDVREGDEVTFEIVKGPKGNTAVNVTLVQ